MTLGSHLLGRVAPPDDRHVQLHPFRAALPASVEVTLAAPTLSDYDQGATPRCVAYSTSRVVNWLNHYRFDSDWLYDECKRIDAWPGEDGTSARYACDVLRNAGHWRVIRGARVKAGPRREHGIASNTWAVSVDDMRAVFARAKPQPVLIGVPWYSAWFMPEPRAGEHWLQPLHRAGAVAGGHEIGVWAASDKRQAFGLRNTWGSSWPSLAWLGYDQMSLLFGQDSDACIINDLPTR